MGKYNTTTGWPSFTFIVVLANLRARWKEAIWLGWSMALILGMLHFILRPSNLLMLNLHSGGQPRHTAPLLNPAPVGKEGRAAQSSSRCRRTLLANKLNSFSREAVRSAQQHLLAEELGRPESERPGSQPGGRQGHQGLLAQQARRPQAQGAEPGGL